LGHFWPHLPAFADIEHLFSHRERQESSDILVGNRGNQRSISAALRSTAS
jgi:hypothetical protein